MYNKLFTSILDSSLWLESDTTRLVWVTLLASMDQDGFARFASVRNLARRAVVSDAAAEEAIARFEAPDPDSSDEENEGRRIERVPGGWILLNAPKYNEMASAAGQREATRERVRRFRERKRGDGNAPVTPGNAEKRNTNTDVPTDVPTEASTPSPTPSPTPGPGPGPAASPAQSAHTRRSGESGQTGRTAEGPMLRPGGVGLNPSATTPESIIEAHVATWIPAEWRAAWREYVTLWRKTVTDQNALRLPEKAAWHRAQFAKIREYCDASAAPGDEPAHLLRVGRAFLEHGAAHKAFGARIRGSNWDAGQFVAFAKTGYVDLLSRQEEGPEPEPLVFDEVTEKCYRREDYQKLVQARRSGKAVAPPRNAAPEPPRRIPDEAKNAIAALGRKMTVAG